MTATTIFLLLSFFIFHLICAGVYCCSASRTPVVCLFVLIFSFHCTLFSRGLDMGTRCSPISPFYAFAPGYVSILVGIA